MLVPKATNDIFWRGSGFDICIVDRQGGSTLRVTNDNKEEFVDLACRRRLVDSIKPQARAAFPRL